MSPEPSRRDVDRDRRKWNDKALDLLAGQVEQAHEAIRDIRRKLNGTAAGNGSGIDWRTVLTIVTLITVPIVVAIIGARGGP